MTTTMVTSKTQLLLIATDDAVRLRLAGSLKEAGYEVVAASSEASALDSLQHAAPSLVLIDRRSCNVERLRLHKLLRVTPVVAIEEPSVKCEEDECIDDLDRGADLVLCNQSARELIARVRALLRRNTFEPKTLLRYASGGVEIDLDRHEVHVNGKLVELTPKEFQILRHFLESPSRVFSRQEMLNCVWGEGYALEEHALDVHIHSLRQKIEADPSKPKLIVTVRGVGYKLRAGV